jgi:hypothetical protein
MRLQFGEQLNPLTAEDSQRAFAEYIQDAQKRLLHDQDFPDEPKQIRPGEDVKMEEGRVQVSGLVAVMAINEKLVQSLLEKNPERSFAIGESFPLRSTYADAVPLGPIMELRADAANSFTPERATQSRDLWRDRAQQILADPQFATSTEPLKIYSHDAVAAANLLAAHNYSREAEETYRVSQQLWPANPESTISLAALLFRTGRQAEADRILEEFRQRFPDQVSQLEKATAFIRTAGP